MRQPEITTIEVDKEEPAVSPRKRSNRDEKGKSGLKLYNNRPSVGGKESSAPEVTSSIADEVPNLDSGREHRDDDELDFGDLNGQP